MGHSHGKASINRGIWSRQRGYAPFLDRFKALSGNEMMNNDMKTEWNFGDKPSFACYPAGFPLGKRFIMGIPFGLFCLFFCTLLLTNCHAWQQPGQAAQTLDQTIQASSLDALLTQLAIKHLPQEYVDDRKWGMQAERWDGVKFERKNGRITTHRRWKTVNDGTWKKYSIRPRNPQQTLVVQLTNIRELDEGQAGGRLGFTVVGYGDVDFEAQIVDWKKGVKAFSISLEGHGSSQVEVDLELAIQVDGLKFPPDLILFPRATDVRLQLDEFRIDRIGKVGGEIAQQIGREARKQLERKLPEQRQKLLEKINHELSKKEDGHRISFSDIKGSKFNDAISRLIGN